MEFKDRLATLRRRDNITQEGLAAYLGVSRQAVSKWESGLALPETDKLVRLAELFGVSVDYLLTGKESAAASVQEQTATRAIGINMRDFRYEYKSQRTLWGLPLVHVCVGVGRCHARGIVAVGNTASGILAIGLASYGLLSIGLFSCGLLALGVFALGLAALGSIAVGILAAGAIAVGIFAVGGVAVGLFSVGGLAFGHYAALGDRAYAQVAVGASYARGAVYEASSGVQGVFACDTAAARAALEGVTPAFLRILSALFAAMLP